MYFQSDKLFYGNTLSNTNSQLYGEASRFKTVSDTSVEKNGATKVNV